MIHKREEIAKVHNKGIRIGAIGLRAMLTGYYGTMVPLDTSDEVGALEAAELLECAETLADKKGIGTYAGFCRNPGKCQELIYQGSKRL